MKRDIRINYGKIEDIIAQLSKYDSSLSIMMTTMQSIKGNLKKSESEAVTSLLENFSIAGDDIRTCKKELADIKTILSDYINDISKYATPNQRGNLMQIDRNDVYWNMESIASALSKLLNASYYGRNYYGSYSSDKDNIADERYNGRKIDSLNESVSNTINRLNDYMDQLRYIHNNKIIPFENTDDDYKGKAWDLYWNYTGFGEWIGDFFNFLGESLGNVVSGILDALHDLVVGLYELAKGIIFYLGSGLVVLVTMPFGATPSWASEYFDNTNNMIGDLLSDPMILFEGIVQGASDAIDTKGICYSGGYIIGSMIGIKGLDKAAKGIKGVTGLSKSKIAVNSVDDLVKLGYEVDDLAKFGINNSDDLARLGLDSIDDINKLKSKLVELKKGASGSKKTLSSIDAEENAFKAIKGSNKADDVVLGKFKKGSSTSYDAIAKDMDAQYFNLDNWDELSSMYSSDEIWKINEKFLDIQTSSGREIYLSHNPAKFLGDGSYYSKEIQYLIDNGYKFVKEGDIWHAIR